jgi:hypothetical protein
VILADASVWIDHLRRTDLTLTRLLYEDQVLGHPFVIGEIALRTPARRELTLRMLRRLPAAVLATHDEVMALVERERLYGQGVGYVDAHLVAATRLTPQATLWTRDRRLRAAAVALGLASPLT